MNTKFSQIGKLVDKNFILLSNGSFSKIRFSRKQVIEIDADNRRRYMAYIDYVHGAIACLADNSSEEKDKQFLEAIESQFSLISHCMNNEFYRFMQFAPGANDFDTENFVISGLFGIKNGQIFIEWEGEDILIAEEILDPTNLLASGIYGIGEAKHEGIISNDCYTYFMDLVSSFKPEIKPLKSEIFKKKVKIS